MFTIEVILDYRPSMPQTTFPAPLRHRAIGGHWTAGGIGITGALGSIQYLIDHPERNASYHETWAWERARKHLQVRRIVRPERAAHSFNPKQPPWNPTAYVRSLLGDAWADPNRVTYTVSYAGGPADIEADVQDPDFIAACRTRLRQLEAELGIAAGRLFMHAEGQPGDKSDWGASMNAAMKAVPEADVPVITRPVREKWAVPAGMTFWLGGPGFGTQKQFDAPIELWSNGETLDGKWRRLEYHDSPTIGEELWADGNRTTRKMQPIPGTRNPATGYGPPTTADCSAQEATISVLNRKISDARVPAAATVEALR